MDLNQSDICLAALTVALEQQVVKLGNQKNDLMRALDFILRNPKMLNAFISAQETVNRIRSDDNAAS